MFSFAQKCLFGTSLITGLIPLINGVIRFFYPNVFIFVFGFFQRTTQFTCTAVFLLWGVLVHLVIPPFVFMSQEGWTYIEGLYFSFVTLTTVGFGDLVAGKCLNY